MPEAPPNTLARDPQWPVAYVTLLSSPMFDRVRSLGGDYPAISQARTDVGFALQAAVPDDFKQASTSQAIAILITALENQNESLTAEEISWLDTWNQNYQLRLSFPWSQA